MASYQEHLARQEANKQTGVNGKEYNGPKVHFMSEFLAKEGDTAVVRFPYNTMNDIVYTDTHLVAMPGSQYGKRVRCVGANCPFCAQGVKVDERVFVKFLVYTIDDATNTVVINNTVWDRPAAFADIELKGLMEEYGAPAGGLSNVLFKIKRTGSGPSTRYPILPIVNAAVYNPETYKADFTALKDIDPEKILSKSLEQYNAAINPAAAQPAAQPAVQSTPVQNTYAQPTYAGGYVAPTPTPVSESVPTYNAPVQPATPVGTPVGTPVTPAPGVVNQVPNANPVPFTNTTPSNVPGQQAPSEPARPGKYHF